MRMGNKTNSKLKYGFTLILGANLIFFIDLLLYVFKSSIIEYMDAKAWLYYILASWSQASLFALILFLVGYLIFALTIRKQRVGTIVFCVLCILAQIIIMVDIMVFDIYKFHLNGFVFEMIIGGGATDVFVFDWSLYAKFFLFVLVFSIFPFSLNCVLSNRISSKVKSKFIKGYFILFIVSLLGSHIGHAIAHEEGIVSVQRAGTAIPLYYPLTARRLLKKLGIVNTENKDLSYNQVSNDIQYPIHELETTDSIPNLNILLILIDSWNPKSFDPITAPNITSFGKNKGQIFTQHLSSSNATRPGVFGMFFSMPYTYGRNFTISKVSPLIIDRLIEANYDIKIFPSANLSNPPLDKNIFRRVPDIKTSTNGNSVWERDQQITSDFIKFLGEDHKKPFFSLVFYDLPHAITLPKEHHKFNTTWEAPNYMNLNNNLDPTEFYNLYRNCVYFDDNEIGQILDSLDVKGYLKNTVVIITGDHSQEFNENKQNYWGHNSNFSKWQIQVPMIMYYPGIEAGKVNRHVTTHYDITPTLMKRHLGVKNPISDYSLGYDLWNPTSRYPHVVSGYTLYGYVTDSTIITTEHSGLLSITDNMLKELPKSVIKKTDFKETIKRMNHFYKR